MNYKDNIPLPYDLLVEFIEDANSKDESILDYELGYLSFNNNYKIDNSKGLVLLNRPKINDITLRDENSDNDLLISPVDEDDNIPPFTFDREDDLCIVRFINRISGNVERCGIVCNLTLGLSDGVCISTDIDGTDWTGYLGGIVLTEGEYEDFFVEDDENEED